MKRKGRVFIAIALALAICLVFAGCTDKKNEDSIGHVDEDGNLVFDYSEDPIDALQDSSPPEQSQQSRAVVDAIPESELAEQVNLDDVFAAIEQDKEQREQDLRAPNQQEQELSQEEINEITGHDAGEFVPTAETVWINNNGEGKASDGMYHTRMCRLKNDAIELEIKLTEALAMSYEPHSCIR